MNDFLRNACDLSITSNAACRRASSSSALSLTGNERRQRAAEQRVAQEVRHRRAPGDYYALHVRRAMRKGTLYVTSLLGLTLNLRCAAGSRRTCRRLPASASRSPTPTSPAA